MRITINIIYLLQRYTYEGSTNIASGWGATSFGGAISNTLQYIEVPTVPETVCNASDSYNGAIDSDTMICAGINLKHCISSKKTFFVNIFQTQLLKIQGQRAHASMILEDPQLLRLMVIVDTPSLELLALVMDVVLPASMVSALSSQSIWTGLLCSMALQ